MALTTFLRRLLSLFWLTGPIFEKELRVSSRRRRNYVLRFIYLAALALFMVLIWLLATEAFHQASAVQRIAQMSIVGKSVIASIAWFQFIALQLLAIIILSTSISDEVYNRTLGILMTTPINSFQIVMGKLLSKLLQLFLLVAISLPLLALVRVFGGVPWDYIISSLSMTIAVVVFVGSLSLFYSILNSRAYAVIILTVLTLVFLFLILPLLTFLVYHALLRHAYPGIDGLVEKVMYYPNPYIMFFYNTMVMMEPRAGRLFGILPLWQIPSALLLAASALILLLSVLLVRKVALRQISGDTDKPAGKKRKSALASPAPAAQEPPGKIRRVNGSPVLWKELRTPFFRRHRLAGFISILLAVVLLLITYILLEHESGLHDDGVQGMYILIFLSIGILFTIILPAASITSEKEARSWPLLLATTLNNTELLFGKFLGAVRRCIIPWLFLFAHLFLFASIGYIHPVAIPQMAILVTWLIILLTCTGLCFSSLFKHTTTAVVMNFVLPAVLWAAIPFLLAVITEINHSSNDFLEIYMDTNPFVHAVVIVMATARRPRSLGHYDWVHFRNMDAAQSTIWMLGCMFVYILIGLFFIAVASKRLRRKVF